MMQKKTTIDLLETLREQQDDVDREIIKAIVKRLELRKKISAYRIGNDLPTVDPVRRAYVLQQAEKIATENNMPPEMANDVFQVLIDWSHRLDRDWRNTKS